MRSGRMMATAAAGDFGLYLLLASLPWRAVEGGASSMLLGIIPLLYALPYGAMALHAGGHSDQSSRQRGIRRGALVAALGALICGASPSLPLALSALVLPGLGLAFFWPSLQAAFSELQEGRDLGAMLRRFNMGWSIGKAAGFFGAGILVQTIGPRGAALAGAGAFLLAAAAIPPLRAPAVHSTEDYRRPNDARQDRFAIVARVANALGFGFAATLTVHLPALDHSIAQGAAGSSFFLALIFLVQTLSFLLLGQWTGWRYRAVPLVAALIVASIALRFGVGLPPGGGRVLLALPLGLALGFCYKSSIYYAVDSRASRGRRAGLHEASLGIGGALLPLIGGLGASLIEGPSHLLLPFQIAAALGLATAIWCAYRLRPRTSDV